MKDLFFEKFDKISMLTLSNRKDKLDRTLKMLSNFNIYKEDLDIHVATPFPYNQLIINAFNSASTRRCFTKPNEYDCARNHYSIVKQAYDEGINNLLVIEDDNCFLKDLDKFKKYIQTIPEDFDLLQFGAFTTDKQVIPEILSHTDETWVKHKNVQLWTTSMYALSRKGMEFYLAFMNKWFTVADMPLYMAPKNDKILNSYASTIPLVIQADKNIVPSDIRDSNNDQINYAHDNIYESLINKTDYFEY